MPNRKAQTYGSARLVGCSSSMISPRARFLSLFLLGLQWYQIYSKAGFSPGCKVVASCLWGNVLLLLSSERVRACLSFKPQTRVLHLPGHLRLSLCSRVGHTRTITVTRVTLGLIARLGPGLLPTPAAIARAGGRGPFHARHRALTPERLEFPQRKIWGL